MKKYPQRDIFSSSLEITDICCDSEASKAMYKYLCDKINNNEIYYEPILDYDYKNTLFSSFMMYLLCKYFLLSSVYSIMIELTKKKNCYLV